MHQIEPFWNWRDYYVSEDDINSPFYQNSYSEIYFSNTIYNYYIHPQWDFFGSRTLYLKILFADYDLGYCIIEFIGEWNDCLYNDIMYLKRDVVEWLVEKGITKFILIGENVLNFHYSDDDYYQEWFEDIDQGWIVGLGFLEHVVREFRKAHLNNYIQFEDDENWIDWRILKPQDLLLLIEQNYFEKNNRYKSKQNTLK